MTKDDSQRKKKRKKEKLNRVNAFLVRCSDDEARLIRTAARRERRSINGFILHSVMIRLEVHRRTDERLGRLDAARRDATLGM
jgi:uncharacterized protein (DUF1778 family)